MYHERVCNAYTTGALHQCSPDTTAGEGGMTGNGGGGGSLARLAPSSAFTCSQRATVRDVSPKLIHTSRARSMYRCRSSG